MLDKFGRKNLKGENGGQDSFSLLNSSRDELYKNRSSRKTDFQKEKTSFGSPILLKIVSEN